MGAETTKAAVAVAVVSGESGEAVVGCLGGARSIMAGAAAS